MSATIKYKGNTIASITTDSSKTLKTSGKYCEGDIVVENVQDGGITPSGNKAITAATSTQTGIDVTNYATVSVAPTPSETKSVTTNGDVTPSSGKLLSKVTVNVPTGTARDSSDLTVSGATVNVPAGLYSSEASKSVVSGTAGTPTASKGAVSNNSVTVTPSVTNTEGYITGGTKTGTGVKVSASELVSGNKAITPSETAQSGIDVTNFKTASVGAISSTYVGSGVSKKAAATVAPSTSEQTVCASGVYTTGAQKVSAITPSIVGNLDASSFAASIVAAVEGKGVTVPDGTLLDGMAALIEGIEAGGGGTTSYAKWNDVTFIDYDGTVLYSYSLAEVSALTQLPELPTHDGLICQGWNWTLEAIKALNRTVTVGAIYITDDGSTRLRIRIATEGRMTVPLYIGQSVANGVSIDWGDGSAAQTLSGTGNRNTMHTYADPGDYVISLMPNDGCTLSLGNDSSSYCVMGSTESNGRVYCNMLQSVSVGKNVTSIGDYAFYNCYSLASVTIPDGVTYIGKYAFYNFHSLASITIPGSVTSLEGSVFYYCYSLASVSIPERATYIGREAFYNCYSLASVTIPDGVTYIGKNVFYNCYSLASITIPGSVTSLESSIFSGCYSLASVTIPDGVTYIGSSAFYNCYSLASITIPGGVTSIANYTFYNCYGMRYYDFSSFTNVPSLSNTDTFLRNPSDFQMLIPTALFNEWSTATNWTAYASKMVAV